MAKVAKDEFDPKAFLAKVGVEGSNPFARSNKINELADYVCAHSFA
jgi:hypothetical protein